MTFARADAVLASLGRMASTSELLRLGVTERELTRAVRTGTVVRARQGVYALPETSPALLHAARHGGTIGCCAAGALHGLWILDIPPRVHIWMGRAGASRLDCTECRIHWDDGRVRVGILPPVENVLLQIAVCAGEETFFAALESALRQALLSPAGLRWLRRRLPADLKWLIAFARSDADSGLESLLRLRLHRMGIRVRTQALLDGVGEVDLVIGEHLIIEADGRENHGDEAARMKDLRRDAAASARGFETLRFTYRMIVHEWPAVEAAIRGALLRHAAS